MRDTHPTTCGDIEASQFTTLVDNSDEADVIGKDVDIVSWRDCDSNFELRNGDQVFAGEHHLETNFSRQIIFAIERLEVLECLPSHQLLVQPDFVVSSRPWQKMFADTLCKCVHLVMQFG